MLVLFDGWTSFFRDRVVPWRIAMAQKVRAQLEDDTLPRFLEAQRWYAAKGETVKRATLLDYAQWQMGESSWLVVLLDVESAASRATYFLPLALAWEDGGEERLRRLAPATIARVRQQASVGVLADAFADPAFCRALVAAIRGGAELATAGGRLRFTPTSAFARLAGERPGELPVTPSRAQTSNTTAALGERLFLKGYRRPQPGVNPELEMGRFLTDVAGFEHCIALAGALEYTAADGTPMTLALLQAYVPNQGDGWSFTADYLERFFSEQRVAETAPPPDVHGAYLDLMRTLGRRSAELHRALASSSADPAFQPERITGSDLADWVGRARDEAARALDRLQASLDRLPEAARDEARALLEQRRNILARMGAGIPQEAQGLKIRYHGDYHLAQVLLSKNDFFIIDFEGEPARPLTERRRKHSPLRDVAGMLRSFNYARCSALLHATAERPDDLPRLERFAQNWEREARAAFLDAYREAVRAAELYGDFESTLALLGLFELEKAFYELDYELANRPDWVRVPLQGILGLVSSGG
jgi:maltose alpha-D-glucosyltransferase/alpha-amylase